MALTITPKPRITKKTLESVRILTLDIERLPGYAKVPHRGLTVEGEWWDLSGWKHVIGRRILPDNVTAWPRSICAAARWYGEKEVMFTSEWGQGGYEAFIQQTWEWFNEADIVIGHNMAAFDEKHLRGAWLEAGLMPPSPWKTIDTLKVARGQFNLESNTLAALCVRLGVPTKVDKYDAKIAHAALAGDTKAQKRLQKYNEGDILATEALFDRLRPYIKNAPHLSMWTGSEHGCPSCGYEKAGLTPAGTAYANVTKYKSFQCEKCGTWSRGTAKLQDSVKTRAYK